MNATDLYAALRDDGWGRHDDVLIHTEGSYFARLSCPLDSPTCQSLVQLANDLAETLLSESTNNDACELMISTKADTNDGFYYVTAVVTDYLS